MKLRRLMSRDPVICKYMHMADYFHNDRGCPLTSKERNRVIVKLLEKCRKRAAELKLA